MSGDLFNDTSKDIIDKLVSDNKKLNERINKLNEQFNIIASCNTELIEKVNSCEAEIKSLQDNAKMSKYSEELERNKEMNTANEIDKINIRLNAFSPICEMKNANELFIKSTWYQHPSYFYYWANFIDFSNKDVLAHIITNFNDAYKNALYDYNAQISKNAIPYINYVINTIGYNVDTLVDIKGVQKSFSIVYLIDMHHGQ